MPKWRPRISPRTPKAHPMKPQGPPGYPNETQRRPKRVPRPPRGRRGHPPRSPKARRGAQMVAQGAPIESLGPPMEAEGVPLDAQSSTEGAKTARSQKRTRPATRFSKTLRLPRILKAKMASSAASPFRCYLHDLRGVPLAARRRNHYFERRHFSTVGAWVLKGTLRNPGAGAQKTKARKVGVSLAREARF